MRPILTILLTCLNLTTFAQTIVQSMQMTNNDKTLTMNIIGQRNERPFRHTVHFDVTGMTQPQRDSLYAQTLQTLRILGITDVSGLTKPGPDAVNQQTNAKARTNTVTLQCETCLSKGYLEIYGDNYLHTSKLNSKRHSPMRFPLRLPLSPGSYYLVYVQKGQRIQLPFTVKADEANIVTMK